MIDKLASLPKNLSYTQIGLKLYSCKCPYYNFYPINFKKHQIWPNLIISINYLIIVNNWTSIIYISQAIVHKPWLKYPMKLSLDLQSVIFSYIKYARSFYPAKNLNFNNLYNYITKYLIYKYTIIKHTLTIQLQRHWYDGDWHWFVDLCRS